MSRTLTASRRKDAAEEFTATALLIGDDVDEVMRAMCKVMLALGIRLRRQSKARLAQLESALKEVS